MAVSCNPSKTTRGTTGTAIGATCSNNPTQDTHKKGRNSMAVKSCRTCPSYLDNEDTIRSRFGKSMGVPMCGRYGHILGRPGEPDNDEITVHFASKCPDHNNAMSMKPLTVNPLVVEPVEEVLAKGPTGDEVGTCNACTNCVNQGTVMQEVGFPLSICKAKGALILKPLTECKGCPWASPGTASMDAESLILQPHLQVGFKVPDEAKLIAVMGSDMKIIEPSTYKSDLPVSDEDAQCGILAWRKFIDPETGNAYHLPIFNREFFTEEEQTRIPITGTEFGRTGRPEAYVDHANLLFAFLKDDYTLSETLCLVGAPGNGKSQFGIWLAWLMQVPFERFAIRPDMDVDEFLGHPRINKDGDFWAEGVFPTRIIRPGVGVSDEINAAPDPVKFMYRAFMDTGAVRIPYGEAPMRTRHDYFFHLLTMNPAWDARNIGTLQDADADSQRVSYVWVPEPPEPVLKHILRERCMVDGYEIPDKVLDAIIKISADIQAMSGNGYPGTWGLRQDIKVARKTNHYGLVNAYKRAALDALEPDVVTNIVAIIEGYGVK